MSRPDVVLRDYPRRAAIVAGGGDGADGPFRQRGAFHVKLAATAARWSQDHRLGYADRPTGAHALRDLALLQLS